MLYKKTILATLLCANAFVYAQDEVETIAPDRPGFGDATSIVPTNQLQLETGFQFEQINFEVAPNINYFERNISLNSSLLRYGINERVEARFDYNILRSSAGSSGEEAQSVVGLAPCRLGLKANILKNKGWVPELTFIGMLGLPWTASEDFRPFSVSPDLQLSGANGVNDLLSICYNLGLSWDGSNPSPQNYYALSAEFSFSDKLGAYLQGRGSTQKVFTGIANDIYTTNLYSEAGVMFYPKTNVQIDLSGGVLLYQDFDGTSIPLSEVGYFFVTAGLSWRFGDK
jgi:Putative MetA-pathway of phenol degradation